MRIIAVDVTNLLYTYPPSDRFRYAGGVATGRLTSLVRVSTDQGLVGVGSAYSHPDLVRTIIEGNLCDLLLGHDPLQVEALWKRMYAITRWYGRKGAAMSALGAVDMALWDLRGQALDKSVAELLALDPTSAIRDRVPAYASALLWRDDPAELGDEAACYVAQGYRGVKMRLGRNPIYDRAAVHAVRQAVGPDVRVMVDGSMRYSLSQALALAPFLAEQDAFWFEEPFLPEQLDDYAALRAQVAVPLAEGENEFGVQGFAEVIRRGAVDIVQPDCCRAGGISECHRVGQMAAEVGLGVATHTWSDAVALVANMHIIASLPNGLTVEVDRTGNPFIDDLLTEPLCLVDGELLLPRGPGLGVTLNKEVIQAHTLPADAPIPPGSYSDMVFGREHWTPAPPYGAA